MSLYKFGTSFDSSPRLRQDLLGEDHVRRQKQITVKKKFQNRFPDISKEQLDYLTKNFSSKEDFVEKILNLEWTYKLDTISFQDEKILLKDEEEFEYLETDFLQEIKTIEKMKEVPIKLIITETDIDPNIRKAFSSLLFVMGFTPTFGIFHTALSVGPWIIEWNDSSLCIPKICVSNRSIISMDIGYSIHSTKQAKDLYDKISDIILEWNTEYTYCQKSPKHPKDVKQGNCHDFISAILEHLEITVKFPSIFQNYLNKMKTDGVGEIVFETNDKNILNKAMIKKKTKFKTHKELDEFVIYLLKKLGYLTLNEMMKDYPGEVALLKGFDRAFWLRHFSQLERLKKNKDYIIDQKFSPLVDKNHSMSCPFDDPRNTLSIMENK